MTESSLPVFSTESGLMPLLPLRDVVVYPHLVIPLFVGRAKSVKALELASENNKQILKQLEKSMLLMEFNQRYLKKFLQEGILSKGDLLDFYMGEEVKDKYKPIEKEISEI